MVRVRVGGAITKRLGIVIGPSLKGSKSLVGWLMLLLSRDDDARNAIVHRRELCNAASHSDFAGDLRAGHRRGRATKPPRENHACRFRRRCGAKFHAWSRHGNKNSEKRND